MLAVSVYAQEANAPDAKSKAKFMYCEIVGTGKLFSSKITVELDFGQATTFFGSAQRLRGEDGKPIKFNSMVDAMNFMGSDGWEFAQAYVVTVGDQNVYHWLLKKDLSLFSEEELKGLIKELSNNTTKPAK